MADKKKKVLKFTGKVIELDIDKIIPYELNNKIHGEKQVNFLANLMGKFGYLDEMIVDQNNILIAGHGRLEGIKKMGYDAVAVKQVDFDSKDIETLRIFHNKSNEYDTEWNLENTKIVLDIIGYDKEIEGLGITPKLLFPEFDAPEFNPDDYETDEEGSGEKKVAVIVYCKDSGEAELCKQDLEGLGRKPTIK